MDGDLAVLEKTIPHANTIAAPVEAWSTGIGDGLLNFYPERKVGFDVFVWHIGETRPEGMTIGAVPHGTPGNAAKSDLKQLIPFTLLVIP